MENEPWTSDKRTAVLGSFPIVWGRVTICPDQPVVIHMGKVHPWECGQAFWRKCAPTTGPSR